MEEGWKEVYMTAHEYKAEMAREILENSGIKAVVMNQQDTAYKVLGEYLVYVADADYTRSVELLKNLKN
ncbi:putative signal transducing protein [Maribellus maritimus]|uniref:putative signal transducing protein n=1 Tax=Maribellus maritimus TaxID=2870838 RepID=UPI001EEC4339|nr:DUF2007 domain-containing protein [Maribellus maritimus]MCG6186615.1 DUF2007 domain-containing protein [Maribellus maritimus]